MSAWLVLPLSGHSTAPSLHGSPQSSFLLPLVHSINKCLWDAQTSLTWTHSACHPSVAPQSSPNPVSRLTTACMASQTPASLVPLHLQSNHSHIAISPFSPPCAAPLSKTLIAAFFFFLKPCPTPTSLILSSDVNSSRKPSLTDPHYTSLTWFPFLCFC